MILQTFFVFGGNDRQLCVVFNQIASINQFAINAPCDTGFRQTDQCPAQHPWGLQRDRNGVGCHQEEL